MGRGTQKKVGSWKEIRVRVGERRAWLVSGGRVGPGCKPHAASRAHRCLSLSRDGNGLIPDLAENFVYDQFSLDRFVNERKSFPIGFDGVRFGHLLFIPVFCED